MNKNEDSDRALSYLGQMLVLYFEGNGDQYPDDIKQLEGVSTFPGYTFNLRGTFHTLPSNCKLLLD